VSKAHGGAAMDENGQPAMVRLGRTAKVKIVADMGYILFSKHRPETFGERIEI